MYNFLVEIDVDIEQFLPRIPELKVILKSFINFLIFTRNYKTFSYVRITLESINSSHYFISN